MAGVLGQQPARRLEPLRVGVNPVGDKRMGAPLQQAPQQEAIRATDVQKGARAMDGFGDQATLLLPVR